jgi:hypothetical protein
MWIPEPVWRPRCGGRIILKWILEKYDGMICTRFFQLRIGTIGGLFRTWYWACIVVVVCVGVFFLKKLSVTKLFLQNKQTAFKFWNIYSNVFIDKDHIFWQKSAFCSFTVCLLTQHILMWFLTKRLISVFKYHYTCLSWLSVTSSHFWN